MVLLGVYDEKGFIVRSKRIPLASTVFQVSNKSGISIFLPISFSVL